MVEKFFWADAVADKIIKEKGDKNLYVCAAGITPSGQVHIGNFREVITVEMVVRALEDKGKKVRFIYSWDDFDRFRKVPKGIDKSFEKYLGMSISEIPSPFDKSLSYAEFNEKKFEKSLKKIGIKPEFIYQNKMNKKSAYADLIKIALEKKDKIMEILNKYRKEPLKEDWWPIAIYCSSCKKDSTRILKNEGYEVTYECDCGFSETFDIRKKGIISIKWRIDWPLRWKYEGVDFEPGGIDHSVHGGSFTTAREICKEVFNFEPPVYQFYDWISIKGGEAFSSSSGNALSLDEVEEIYEREVLRYLFVGTKPKSAFQISFDNDVIKIYEDFDRLERKYFDGNCNPNEKRKYEMSMVKIPEKIPNRMGFRHLVTLVQVGELDKLSKGDLLRAEKVKNWLEKYAPEEMKFKVQKKVVAKLNKNEKETLAKLREILESKKYNDEGELFSNFYKVCSESGIKNTDFFKAAYKAIINKEKGPRLSSFIIEIGQDKVVELLKGIE